MIRRDALDGRIEPRAHCRSSLRRRTAFVDMVRDHIDQYLRCRADSLPLFHGLIDQRLGFNVQVMRLFDDRLCLIEKIDQRPRPWQSFLNLLKLCFAETGRLPDEFNKPVFQHTLTLLVVCARLIGPEVKLTIEKNPLGNLSGQDWAIMGEIVDAVKTAVPDAANRPAGQVLEYVRAKLTD